MCVMCYFCYVVRGRREFESICRRSVMDVDVYVYLCV